MITRHGLGKQQPHRKDDTKQSRISIPATTILAAWTIINVTSLAAIKTSFAKSYTTAITPKKKRALIQ
ncbi:hypothetical protein, partial [Rivihabitans pingtungensis]|uniref:hypothetical protein n=1 Tax=Rivihabitans pingtungensis TaxID=1054498 RepID=UPI002FDA35CA